MCIRTGSGALVVRIECVGGQPRAVAGAARVVRVHGQPEPRGRPQLVQHEIRPVGRHVGQHRRRRAIRGHRRAAAVSVVRRRRGGADVVEARRVVRLQGEPLRHAAVETLRAPHAHRDQRPVAGSAVERRFRSHCKTPKPNRDGSFNNIITLYNINVVAPRRTFTIDLET